MTLEIVRSFWWIVFPLSWFGFAAYQSWLKAAAHRDALDTLKSFALAGREPPAELVAKFNAR